MTKPKYPQSDALEQARLNAIELLGLHKHNTAQERAKAMGYDLEAFHGTDAPDIESLDPERTKIIKGVFSSTNPMVASTYAKGAAEKGRAGSKSAPNIIPVLLRSASHAKPHPSVSFNKDLIDSFKKSGHKGVYRPESEVAVTFDPSQMRSRFAAFDPARAHEAGLSYKEGGDVEPTIEHDLLNHPNQSKMIGAERILHDSPELKIAQAKSSHPKFKSYRYMSYKNNEPVGVLQFMTDGQAPRSAVIQNAYVKSDQQRQGIGTKLLNRARQDFDLRHSDELSEAGKAFSKYAQGGKVQPTTEQMRMELEARKSVPHLARGGNDFGVDSMVPSASSRTTFDDQPMGNQIIKDVGGNWLTGRLEEDLKPLQRKPRTAGINNHTEQDAAHDEALNNWVDRNLKTYVKNQMATKSDPIRLYIGKRQLEIQSQYLKDKDRAKRIEERAAQETDPNRQANLMQNAQRMHAEAELAKEDAMGHVIPNQKGFPQHNYSDVDIQKERQEAGFPAEGVGESALEKQWERASDEAVASHRIGDIQAAPAQMEVRKKASERLRSAQDALTNKAVNQFIERGLSPDEAMRVVENTSRMELARMVGDTEYPKANVENYALNTPMLEVYNNLHANNPWVDKADPNARVYSPYTGELGFDHIVDILRQDLREGRIKPEQLNKVSIEHAVRRTAERDLEQTKKMRETQIKQTEGMPLVKQYDTGHKWIELAAPAKGEHLLTDLDRRIIQQRQADNPVSQDVMEQTLDQRAKEKLADALKYEGDTMGHCVGGYTPDVIEGRSRIFSLRDAKGEPHVTIETQPNQYLDFNKWWEQQTPQKQVEINQRARRGEHNMSVFEAPEYLAARAALPPRIVQIKGKGNGKPAAKYIPMVQDFVKSGNWTDVGDLHNTGLVPLGNGRYESHEEAKKHYAPRVKSAIHFLKTHPAFKEQHAAKAKRDSDLFDMDYEDQRKLEQIYGQPIHPKSNYSASELLTYLQNPEDHVGSLQEHYPSLNGWLQKAEEGMAHHGYTPPNATGGTIRMAKGGSTGDIDEMRLALMNKAKFMKDSKVKKRVYHGTKSHDDYADNEGEAIRQFTGLANWTAEEPYTSNGYAGSTGYSMPLHIKIKKPLRLGFDLNGHVEDALKAAKRLGVDTSIYSDDMEPHHVVNSPEFIEAAIRKGYDGISAKESGRMTHAVFDPLKIKSATGNRGTYDTSNPDITKAKGGTIKDHITITERPL
jgi:ribosomal protein S18 acetylase RimI-like enzyme